MELDEQLTKVGATKLGDCMPKWVHPPKITELW